MKPGRLTGGVCPGSRFPAPHEKPKAPLQPVCSEVRPLLPLLLLQGNPGQQQEGPSDPKTPPPPPGGGVWAVLILPPNSGLRLTLGLPNQRGPRSWTEPPESAARLHLGGRKMKDTCQQAFPGSAVVRTLSASAGTPGSIPGQGKSTHVPGATKSVRHNY